MTNFVLYLLTLTTLLSCLSQTPNSTRLTSNNDSSTTDDTKVATHPYSAYWSSSENYPTSIRVRSDIDGPIYLRGTQIDKFLRNDANFYLASNKILTYCLTLDFSAQGAKKQLRVLAIPQNKISLDGTSERKFRLVFDGEEASTYPSCQGTVSSITSANAAYEPEKLCTNCTLTFSSTNVALYASYSGISDQYLVPSSSVDLSSLSIVFDPLSNSTGEGTTCTDSQCKAIDKDCCLNGQCVTHGAVKPNASSDPNYATALASVAQNPNNIYKWESIYFLCPNFVPGPGDDEDSSEVDPDADLAKKLKDLKCLEDYESGIYSSCTSSPTFTGTGSLQDYIYVKKQVLKSCGCVHEQNQFPPYNASPFCSDWALETVTNDAGEVVKTQCYAIVDENENSTDFSYAEVSLSSRTVPHRFYETTSGLSIDDVEGLASTVVQEGESFSYQDQLNQTDPQNGTFNMNSILGQMLVDLTQARPAKVVKLDYQQSYLITVSSGNYTPCAKCSADSWYNSYFAHPANLGIYGLQGVGYQTSRMGDDAVTNSRGNYEDTIFGRACWVPPTMIPFTHSPNADLQTQRQNRLKTQAALFINGYQRDWYGFNKGAVIGSFDGVSWFAIGRTRRIISTSNRLFLAINSPFGDLASSNTISIVVTKDNSNATASEYDYDPNIDNIDSTQNLGASCQRYHYCEKDSDCVSKLGWEYACADTSTYRTTWPVFDASANEKANTEISRASFFTIGKILHGVPDTSSKKRCVYRGAGAPCKANYSDLTTNAAKLFTCAPNFYCSNLSNDDFNTEVARMPGELDVILYGQEADVLGRPLHYITRSATSKSLSSVITSNIKHNAEIFSSNTGDWGICRPGKRLATTNLEQHRYPDSGKRTDYISQISSCDSSLIGPSRASSCPILEEDTSSSNYGNYLTNGSSPYLANNIQNMCGKESQSSTGESAFSTIEGQPLTTLFYITNKIVAQDACLRRAGAICHTDLDCGPNKLHATEAARRGISYFGGTKAEQEFWQESLVCGQAAETPSPNTEEYQNYDMSKNRCCREIGKDITLYTQTSTLDLQDSDTDDSILDLQVSKFPYTDPKAAGRYSRYASVGKFGVGSDATAPYYGEPRVYNSPSGIRPTPYQWKTIHDTARRTCCGGGWVRKFADGSTNWTNLNRLKLNVSNFACINYQNEVPMLESEELTAYNIASGLYGERYKLCERASSGGCSEYPIRIPDLFEIELPEVPGTTTAVMNTTPQEHSGTELVYQNVSREAPYIPTPYSNTVDMGYEEKVSYFYDHTYQYVSFYLPLFIGGRPNINSNSIAIQYMGSDSSGKRIIGPTNILSPYAGTGTCVFPANPQIGGLAEGEYCFDSTTAPGYVIFHARAVSGVTVSGSLWSQAGIVMTFNVPNTTAYNYNDSVLTANKSAITGMVAGNAMYYLTKLGRLELVGIPQIFYEPIYCNSNRNKLVEGIFKTGIETRSDFYNNSFYYASGSQKSLAQIYDSNSSGLSAGSDPQNFLEEVVFGDKLDIDPIFSASDVKCCMPLGEYTSQYKNCCSSFGVWDSDKKKYQCLLPAGTDLNVYFNRFVSGEGIDVDDEIQFEDTDFIPETGEPKLTSAVYDKIHALGEKFCASKKVKKGSAFGYFNAGNVNSFISVGIEDEDNCAYRQYQLIDSNNDNEDSKPCNGSSGTVDADNRNGYNNFIRGFRWNHHYYCAPYSSN